MFWLFWWKWLFVYFFFKQKFVFRRLKQGANFEKTIRDSSKQDSWNYLMSRSIESYKTVCWRWESNVIVFIHFTHSKFWYLTPISKQELVFLSDVNCSFWLVPRLKKTQKENLEFEIGETMLLTAQIFYSLISMRQLHIFFN